MRVFTKHTKVIGIAKNELEALSDMVREADTVGKAERQMSETEYIAIVVGEEYSSYRHPMTRSASTSEKAGKSHATDR